MLFSLLNPETFPAAITQIKDAYLSETWFAKGEKMPLPFGKPLRSFFETPKGNAPFNGIETGQNAGNYHHFVNVTAATAHFVHHYIGMGEMKADEKRRLLTLMLAAFYHDVGKTVCDRRHAVEGKAFFAEPKASTQFHFTQIFASHGLTLKPENLHKLAILVGAHDLCGTMATGENSTLSIGPLLKELAALYDGCGPQEKERRIICTLFDLWLLNRADIMVSMPPAPKWAFQESVTCVLPGESQRLAQFLESDKEKTLRMDFDLAAEAARELCAGRDADAFLAARTEALAAERMLRLARQGLGDVISTDSAQFPSALAAALRARLSSPRLTVQVNDIFSAELGEGWQKSIATMGQLDYALGFFQKLGKRILFRVNAELAEPTSAARIGWIYSRKDNSKSGYPADYLDAYNAESIVSNWLVILAGLFGGIARLTSGIGLWNIEFGDATARLTDSKADKLLLLDGPHRAAATRAILLRELMLYRG